MDKDASQDPQWFAIQEAIELRTAQLGDRDLAILDLERAIKSGKLRGIRWSYATNDREDLTGPVVELFAWFYGYHGLDDWLYSVWKPDFDALFYVSQAASDGDGGSKEPVKSGAWQVSRVKELLPRAFPDGVPANASNKEVLARLAPLFDKKDWKHPGVDSIRRARGRR